MSWNKERYDSDPVYRSRKLAAARAWKKANRVKVNDAERRRRRANPEALREDRLRRTYGITRKDYDAMVDRQGGLCALCRRKPVEKNLCVDHCHDTHMLRLLLCDGCNTGLGKFGHNPDLLRFAADYVEIWRIIHARRLAAGFKPIPIRTSKRKKRKDGNYRPPSPSTPDPNRRD